MKIESIEFLLGEIDSNFDGCVDVAVKLENGRTYVVVVATTKDLVTLMDNEKSDFISAGDPMIIVRKLTKEVVEKAIEAYTEGDAYYLKFYAAELDVKTLDVLDDRYIARSKFMDDLLEKGESLKFENYNLIDFNINNDSNNNCG